MTNSWEWVEKQNRRDRRQKRMRLAVIIVVPLALFSVYGIPPLFRGDDSEPPTKDDASVPPVVAVVDSDAIPANTSATDHHPEQVDRESSNEPVTEPHSIAGVDIPVPPQTASVVPSAVAPSVDVPSRTPKALPPDPELKMVAEDMLARLNQQVERVDGRNGRLARYGGSEWKSIQAIAKSASSTRDLASAVDFAEQAIGQLDALIPDIDFAEFRDQIRDKDARKVLSESVAFRKSHPEYPKLNELEQTLSGFSRETWLGMAVDELRSASPEEVGFSESWLPIASAWQLVGNDSESRDAVRRAVKALPRMTSPENIVQSTIEICQHESFNPASADQLIRDAAKACSQISNSWRRSVRYAQLSGLSKTLNQNSLSSDLLARSLAEIEKDSFGSWKKHALTQQARAASWSESPAKLFSICADIEKLNYPKPLVIANAYGHAAIAAARQNERTQFIKAMLYTENTLASVRIYDHPNYLYAVRLAEANIFQRRWRSAIIVANNIPDPNIKASILFRVIKNAPQELRLLDVRELFQLYSNQTWASPACAAHTEHRIRSGENLMSIADWSQKLPRASVRAAAFAGVARSTGTNTTAGDSRKPQSLVTTIDVNDSTSLLDAAERVANQIQDPIESAFVWLEIAKAWNLLGKTQRYRLAVTNLDDRLFDEWTAVWEQRPLVKSSSNGGYIDSDDRHRDQEKKSLSIIVSCYRHLAEMQADLGDSDGAMESCLNVVNAAGFMDASPTYDNLNFLRMKALLSRLQGDTGIGAESIPFQEHRSFRYTRALLAAWAKDIPSLEAALPDLVKNSSGRLGSAAERTQPVRAYCELAILHAERGNTEGYRAARRSAQSFIEQGRAGSEMKLMLAMADAMIGEFALAESNLVRGSVIWFGDANRPRKQLAVSLAARGDWEKAMAQAEAVSTAKPLYRAQAWTAVAEARREHSSESADEILDWAVSLESQVDRAAVFCGLGLAAVDGR